MPSKLCLSDINGGAMPSAEYGQADGQAATLGLIQSGDGVATPYGMVCGNGMNLEQAYDGRYFPEYYCEPCVTSSIPE